MTKNTCLIIFPLFLLFFFGLQNPVPYTGKIDIRGVNYYGEAQFAFSLHDGNGTTHWRNGKQPGETIKVTIRNGRYTVLLGGQGMNSLAPELFLNHDKLYLKVKFDTGMEGSSSPCSRSINYRYSSRLWLRIWRKGQCTPKLLKLPKLAITSANSAVKAGSVSKSMLSS